MNDVEQPLTDNLTSQTNLINQLSGLNEQYYTFYTPTLKSQQNVTVSNTSTGVTYGETAENQPKVLTWDVKVPANTQAYLSLFPTNYAQFRKFNCYHYSQWDVTQDPNQYLWAIL